MIEEYGRTFSGRTETTVIVVPENTWLAKVASDVLEMVHAYASDGFVFLDKGDEVNALASFAYGSGWLDTGVAAGLFTNHPMGIPPKGCTPDIPEALSEHLNEKTFRYQRMLASALSSVCINSEPELPLYPAGKEICTITHQYYIAGSIETEAANLADGLALLSYAYGWIDAGVRTGILKVVKNPELFTV
ncbi:DUF357 domain-containing protein [Methanogenium organophilum]|uniref:DUF357 domain-containing protein n=1 Tax=Methanogenium organophilum TaxID=2199 RepID=A0A9X9S4C2_METOG|nr:DUF357 domain-containing protein [Methanogenium organophilum]WAI01296.1 DUF357 domain-containing protein [Methanogenium organophilum]